MLANVAIASAQLYATIRDHDPDIPGAVQKYWNAVANLFSAIASSRSANQDYQDCIAECDILIQQENILWNQLEFHTWNIEINKSNRSVI
jgi:hypothetical protein